MPRLPRLTGLGLVLIAACGFPAAAQTSGHLRAGNLTRPCLACHKGHGVSGTPVLAKSGDDLCLGCHGPAARNDVTRAELGMGPGVNPADVATELRKPYTHGKARCLDCHSAHLAIPPPPPEADDGPASGLAKGSPRRGFASESELCLSCHGSRGPRGADPHDLGARFDPTNPSYHPVLAPGRSSSVPSLRVPLTESSLVNCTDCHGSDSPTGARGPHGSQHASLLRLPNPKQDNQPESPATYALCYRCHDREVVLKRDDFPLHDLHVSRERTACRTCHDPHGATNARALIRFNDASVIAEVAPSASGRVEFLSSGPGSGACYLTCHGKNHDPLGYGAGSSLDGIAFVTASPIRPVGFSAPGPTTRKAVAPEPGSAAQPAGPVDRGRPPRLPGERPGPVTRPPE